MADETAGADSPLPRRCFLCGTELPLNPLTRSGEVIYFCHETTYCCYECREQLFPETEEDIEDDLDALRDEL